MSYITLAIVLSIKFITLQDSKCDMSEVSTTDHKEGSADPSQVESYQEAAAEMVV